MRSYILLLLFASFYASAQTTPCFTFEENEFSISGDAVIMSDDTIRLTQAQNWQSGFIWSQNLINFDLDFSLEAELFFGTQDSSGADGIAFVIQPLSNDEGSNGGGIGYEGISPSLAVEFDTWWNSGADPTEMDHVALVANGLTQNISAHSAYAPFVGVSNLEDGQWHPLSIQWNANDQTLSVELDGQIVISTTIDIVNTFFGGNTGLFWGFTSATGGSNNLHQVKILEFCSVDNSCNTPPPTADSPQTFCASTTLDQLQINGTSIRFYAEDTGDTLLDGTTLITESTTVYITQTIDDCESQDLVAIEISIQEPTILSDPFELLYCQNNNPTANLFEASDLFLSEDFSGFFNSQADAQSIVDIISSPENYTVNTPNQLVYARVEENICYVVYPIILIPETPVIYTDSFEIEYCQGNTSINLYDASDLFLDADFSGFFNTQLDAENLTDIIANPTGFEPTPENQILYARVEGNLCYEVYPILLRSKNCDIVIPQAISPNNDGFNDVFEIQNLYDVHLNHVLKIYNRYGQCIFEGNNNKKWAGQSNDGKLAPVGTYFYVLHLNNEDNEMFTGWVYCNY